MRSRRKKSSDYFNYSLSRNRRGLSEIVANLIIILLVLVAVGIVWVVVRNVISSGSQQIELGQFTFDLSIKSAYVSGTNIVVSVKRNVGGGDILGIKFIFLNATDSRGIEKKIPINELGEKTFTFTSAEISGIIAGDKVSIAPMYSSSGTEKTGTPTDSATISGTAPDVEIPGGDGEPNTGFCGDNLVQKPNLEDVYEECDDNNLPITQCSILSTIYSSGTLSCLSDCTYDVSGCSFESGVNPVCGDNVINQLSEECDGTSLGGESCLTQGFDTGDLSCVSCIFDTSQCMNIETPVCGNGDLETGEACDDGNVVPGDGCSSYCALENPECNTNGICDLANGETILNCPVDCEIPISCDGVWNETDINAGNDCDGTPLPNGCTVICLCNPLGFTKNNEGGCSVKEPLNTGTVQYVFTSEFPFQFSSPDLPYVGELNLQNKYANFTGFEGICQRINFHHRVDTVDYVRLDGIVEGLASGAGYSVWEAENCGQ
jgi:cysteine-rich repeat protein